MLFWLFQPLKIVRNAMRADLSARQVGYGVAMGMMIGLMPKDSLFFVMLTMMMFFFRVNLGAASASAFLFAEGWDGVETTISYSSFFPMASKRGGALLQKPLMRC